LAGARPAGRADRKDGAAWGSRGVPIVPPGWNAGSFRHRAAKAMRCQTGSPGRARTRFSAGRSPSAAPARGQRTESTAGRWCN